MGLKTAGRAGETPHYRALPSSERLNLTWPSLSWFGHRTAPSKEKFVEGIQSTFLLPHFFLRTFSILFSPDYQNKTCLLKETFQGQRSVKKHIHYHDLIILLPRGNLLPFQCTVCLSFYKKCLSLGLIVLHIYFIPCEPLSLVSESKKKSWLFWIQEAAGHSKFVVDEWTFVLYKHLFRKHSHWNIGSSFNSHHIYKVTSKWCHLFCSCPVLSDSEPSLNLFSNALSQGEKLYWLFSWHFKAQSFLGQGILADFSFWEPDSFMTFPW